MTAGDEGADPSVRPEVQGQGITAGQGITL